MVNTRLIPPSSSSLSILIVLLSPRTDVNTYFEGRNKEKGGKKKKEKERHRKAQFRAER